MQHTSTSRHTTNTLDHTQGVPSTAAFAGHPIHPVLVPFPIAFLIGAFAADVAFWWADDRFWARTALWLTGTGLLAGVAAAVVGAVDYLTIERARVHRIGLFHVAGNVTVLFLAAVGWLLRLGDPTEAALPWGLLLSASTAALLVATGWAGGELAFRHMIGVTGHGAEDGDHAHEETGESAQAHQGQPHAGQQSRPGDEGGRGAMPPGMDHEAMGHGRPGTAATEHEGMGHGDADQAASRPGGRTGSPDGASGHDGAGHAGMGHAGMAMPVTGKVSGPELAAVTVLTVLALAVGVVYSAARANLTLSARDVGGLVMPPGMVMTRETSAQSMRDMAAVDPRSVDYTAPRDTRGDRELAPRIEAGVKVYDLDVSVIEWNILPDTRVMAYAFNRQVPGPRIRVTEGDRVRINVRNDLPEPTTVHWHGLILPNEMDGPSEITQEPIPPGGNYTYEFTAQQRGTFFYHSHHEVDRQQALGMYGALIIDPRTPPATPAYDAELVVQLQEWLFRDGYTFPAMPMEGSLPNFFTINGKAYPATDTINMRVGERLLVRFIGSQSGFIHPMHIHGGPFRIIETDGYPVPEGAQWVKDTVNVGPGERYDVIWEAREPGKWLLHCHINHHVTNDNREEQGGGGLMLIINVER